MQRNDATHLFQEIFETFFGCTRRRYAGQEECQDYFEKEIEPYVV